MFEFEENIWIMFEIQGHRLMGRTLIKDGMKLVGVVDDMGGVGHLAFEAVAQLPMVCKLNADETFSTGRKQFIINNLKNGNLEIEIPEDLKFDKDIIEIIQSIGKEFKEKQILARKTNQEKPRIILMGKGGDA